MTSREKYEKMLSLEPFKDRSEMPVFPMLVATYGKLGGVSQKDIVSSPDKWLEAVENTFAKIGVPDVSMPICAGDTVFNMALPARIPGRELDDEALYQFVEKPYFDDPAEYDRIMEMGYGNWFFEYMMNIQTPPYTSPEQLQQRYALLGQNNQKTYGYFYKKGIVPAFDLAMEPIFDQLSMIRSMADFICDFYEDPGPIMDIIRKYQPIEDQKNIEMMKAIHGRSINLFAMRSSSSFISPSMYEEYVWPELKASILRYHEAGFLSIIHADSNWLPMLKYFTELPKGCCHIELDGTTDIFAAYDILRGSQSIRGDVPSTMFAYGTPDEVSEYCEKLVQMGMKGGFMLSSGCEIPLNAKLECVQAMMNVMK